MELPGIEQGVAYKISVEGADKAEAGAGSVDKLNASVAAGADIAASSAKANEAFAASMGQAAAGSASLAAAYEQIVKAAVGVKSAQAQIIGSSVAQADAAIATTASLEGQKAALLGITSTLQSQAASFEKWGAGGAASAALAGEAIDLLRAKIAKLDVELSSQSVAGLRGRAGEIMEQNVGLDAQLILLKGIQTELRQIIVAQGEAGAVGAAGMIEASDALAAVTGMITGLKEASAEADAVTVAELRAQAEEIMRQNIGYEAQLILLKSIEAQLRRNIVEQMAPGGAGIAGAAEGGAALAQVQGYEAQAAAAKKAAGAAAEVEAATNGVTSAQLRQAGALSGLTSGWGGFISMLAQFAPLAIAAGLALVTKNALGTAVQIEYLSQRFGMSTEDMSTMYVAAAKVGYNIDSLGMSFRMLARHIDDALHGKTQQIQQLQEALHMPDKGTLFDYLQRYGGDSAKILRDIATGVENSTNKLQEMAKIQELLGRSGGGGGGAGGSGQLPAFLHEIAGDNWAKATEDARRFGVVVSEETGAAAVKFLQTWNQIKLELMGVGMVMLQAVLPALQMMASAMVDAGAKGDSLSSSAQAAIGPLDALSIVVKALSLAMIGLSSGMRLFTADTSGMIDVVDKLSHADLSGAKKAFDAMQASKMQIAFNANNAIQGVFGFGSTPAPIGGAPGGLDYIGKPISPEREKALLDAKNAELAIAQKQLQVANASDVLDAKRLESELKVLEIQKQAAREIDQITTQRAKGEITPTAAAQAIGDIGQAAMAKIAAANAKYSTDLDKTIRQENEKVRALQAQATIAQLQIGLGGRINDLSKEDIENQVKLAEIHTQAEAKRAGIEKLRGPSADPTAGKQIAAENVIEAAKTAKQDADHLKALQDIRDAMANNLKAMNATADAAEKNLGVARSGVELERLRSAAIQTTATIARQSALERLAIETDYENKRAAIAIQVEQKIADLQKQQADDQKRMAVGGEGANAALENYKFVTKEIEALRRTALAETEKEAADSDTKIMQSHIQAVRTQITADQQLQHNANLERLALAVNTAQAAAEAETAGTSAFTDAIKKLEGALYDQMVGQQAVDRWQRAGNTIGQSLITGIQDVMSGQKLGAVLGNVAKSITKTLTDSFGDSLNNWLKAVAQVAGGGASPVNAAGQPVTGMSQGGAQGTMAALQVGAAALQLYQQGQAGVGKGQNALSGAVSGGVTGASIGFEVGGPYGAVVGAIIGVVAGAVMGWITGGGGADKQYGNVAINQGTAQLIQTQNIVTDSIAKYEQQVQQAFNSTWNGFIKIMTTLPSAGMIPNIPNLIFDKINIGGPSTGWAERFKDYVEDKLPKEIAEMFHAGMEQSFVASGITSAAFEKFWAEAATLDPKARLQFWQDMADGLVAFANAQRRLQNVQTALAGGLAYGTTFDISGNARLPGESEFVSNVRAGAASIFQQAQQMVLMSGPDRVTAWKNIGQSVEQVTKSLTDYINQIATILANLAETFIQTAFEHDLQRAQRPVDYQGNVVTPQTEGQAAWDESVKTMFNLGSTPFAGLSDFTQNVMKGSQSIFQQAEAMVRMTGPDRVNAWKALGQSVDQVTKSLSDYIDHVADVIKNLKQSFQDALYQHALAQAGQVTGYGGAVIHQDDPNARARIMEAEYNRLMNQINNASQLGLTADQVSQYSQQAMSVLESIFAVDPTQAAEEWYQKQMSTLQVESLKALKGLQDAAKTTVDKLLETLKPFTDWFKGLPVDLQDSIDKLTGTVFPGFAEAIDALTKRMNGQLPASGYDASSNVLMTEYNRIMQQITGAATLGLTPDQVQGLVSRALQLLNQIYALNPTDAMDAWWRAQMQIIAAASHDSIKAIGDAAAAAVQQLLTELKPFTDWFKGLSVDLEAADKLLTGPGGVFDGFAAALAALTNRVNNALGSTPSVPGTGKPGTGGGGGGAEPPGGGGGPGGGGLGPGESPGGSQPIVPLFPASNDININVSTGDVIGIDNLHDFIVVAVSEAIRAHPELFERSFGG